MAVSAPGLGATPARASLAMRVRTAGWLGWQIESNWADPLTFSVYTLLRPVGTAFILAGIYWAAGGASSRPELFAAFYLGNAFHEYVTRVLLGMGWVIVEEREEYETLRVLCASPVGMLTYLTGRATVKYALATVSVVIVLALGWWALGLRWDWAQVRWLWLAVSMVLGLASVLFLGFLVAGWALLLPRIAISVNEGIGVALYLLCGVIFPLDLMPKILQIPALALPFTYWYESIRRFVLGHGASDYLSTWSDARLVGTLAATAIAFAVLSLMGYRALERSARRSGRLDQTTLF
jgi:ABC-2 type transport system permease protein